MLSAPITRPSPAQLLRSAWSVVFVVIVAPQLKLDAERRSARQRQRPSDGEDDGGRHQVASRAPMWPGDAHHEVAPCVAAPRRGLPSLRSPRPATRTRSGAEIRRRVCPTGWQAGQRPGSEPMPGRPGRSRLLLRSSNRAQPGLRAEPAESAPPTRLLADAGGGRTR